MALYPPLRNLNPSLPLSLLMSLPLMFPLAIDSKVVAKWAYAAD